MQVVEIIEEVLQTGILSVKVERQIDRLLASCPMNAQTMHAIDQLIDALCQGAIRSVA